MKITREQLESIILAEVNKLQPELQEGVLDYLKGAGSEVGQRVKSFAGDVKNAGALASLRGDLKKASGEAGVQIERLVSIFNDLLARAQSLRMEVEEKEIKAELQALKNYQETAAAELGAVPQSSAQAQLPPQAPPQKTTPAPINLPPMPVKKQQAMPAKSTKANPALHKAVKKPLKTKLDKDIVSKTIKAMGGGPDGINKAAKKLGVSKNALIAALS